MENEPEVRKFNKKWIIIIVSVCLIFVAIGGYFIFNKINSNKNSQVENSNSNNTKTNNKFVGVITGYTYTKNGSGTVPKITSTKNNAIALNNKIMEDMVSYWEKEFKSFDNMTVKTEYQYVIKNNIIAIYTVATPNFWPGSGSGIIRNNYFYDIINDKVLSFGDAIKAMGYTIKDVKNAGANSFDELISANESNDCWKNAFYYIENGVGKIYYRVSTNTECLTKDEISDPNNSQTNNNGTSSQTGVGSTTTYVSDYLNVSKSIKYSGNCMQDSNYKVRIDIKLPIININTTDAKKINNSIQNDYADYIKASKLSSSDQAFYKTNYDYVIKNNVIFIVIKSSSCMGCSSCGYDIKDYFYDIKNSHELSFAEAYAAVGLTLDDMKKVARETMNSEDDESSLNNIKINTNGCYSDSPCGCGLEIKNKEIVPFYIWACV